MVLMPLLRGIKSSLQEQRARMKRLESHYLNICIHCRIIILMMVFVLQNGLLGLKSKVNKGLYGIMKMKNQKEVVLSFLLCKVELLLSLK